MIYNVRVRILTPRDQAIFETQQIEADSGLEAMHIAQAQHRNVSRGIVATLGADSYNPPASAMMAEPAQDPAFHQPEVEQPKHRGWPKGKPRKPKETYDA